MNKKYREEIKEDLLKEVYDTRKRFFKKAHRRQFDEKTEKIIERTIFLTEELLRLKKWQDIL